jgi:preprotein translocase subunit SecE
MADRPNIAPGFLGNVQDELKKVTWPSRKDVIRLTLVVIIISLIIGFYVGIIDILLAKVLDLLTKNR